mmetsp:Transcript_125132/g.354166  ORF Transcript_125132/g.354166 Transcript_125132/m.354166 type:complete len:348 (-) Transcript_125132:53-1096(-)
MTRRTSRPRSPSMSARIHRSGQNSAMRRAANMTSWKFRLRFAQRHTPCSLKHFSLQNFATRGASPENETFPLAFFWVLFRRLGALKGNIFDELILVRQVVSSSFFGPRPFIKAADNPSVLSSSSADWADKAVLVLQTELLLIGRLVGCAYLETLRRWMSPMWSRKSVVISSSPRWNAMSSTVLPSVSSSNGHVCPARRSSMMHAGAWLTATCKNLGVAPLRINAETAGRFVWRIASSKGGMEPPSSKSEPFEARSDTKWPDSDSCVLSIIEADLISNETAQCNALRPRSSTGLMSARTSKRYSAAPTCLWRQARAKGVDPSELRAFRFALARIRSTMISVVFGKSGR